MRKQEHKNVHCFHWHPISHYLCLVFWEHALHFKTTTKPHGDTITPWMCLFSCPHPGSGPQMRGAQPGFQGWAAPRQAPGSMHPAQSGRVCHSESLSVVKVTLSHGLRTRQRRSGEAKEPHPCSAAWPAPPRCGAATNYA